jgi:hypothetical protein
LIYSILAMPERRREGFKSNIGNALLGTACAVNLYSGINLLSSEFLNGLPTLLTEPYKAPLLILGTVASALYLRVVIHNVGRQISS